MVVCVAAIVQNVVNFWDICKCHVICCTPNGLLSLLVC